MPAKLWRFALSLPSKLFSLLSFPTANRFCRDLKLHSTIPHSHSSSSLTTPGATETAGQSTSAMPTATTTATPTADSSSTAVNAAATAPPANPPSHPTVPPSPSRRTRRAKWHLSPPPADGPVRAAHYFPAAPSISLAKALFDLVGDRRRVCFSLLFLPPIFIVFRLGKPVSQCVQPWHKGYPQCIQMRICLSYH